MKGKSQPHSLAVGQAALPNCFALITVATPARATGRKPFTLQLRGPFAAGVQARLSPFPGSLCCRFSGYSSSSTFLVLWSWA